MTASRIEHTAEFERIRSLPVFDWERHVCENDGYLRLTNALKTPYGQMTLRPIQAAVLTYLHDYGGAFCPIPVSGGKTLVSFLAPRVINTPRPAILIPAALREKTWREFQGLYKHWFGPTLFMRRADFDNAVFNYEGLSRDGGRDALDSYKPTLIIADEAHALKNRNAAVTKRVERYMYENPDTRFVALSGTMTSRSLMDYWHIAFWCLRDNLPLPRVHAEVEQWADALDEKKAIIVNRPSAQIFMQFCGPEDLAEIQKDTSMFAGAEAEVRLARRGFKKRFNSTPGVVRSHGEVVTSSLQIRQLDIFPGETASHWLRVLRQTKCTPNGEELSMPTEIWRMARELACGFWYRWDPPPPEDWLKRRKAWGWYERQILLRDGLFYSQYTHLHIDSPFQLANAITQGRVQDTSVCEAYYRWTEVRDTYKHDVVAEWIDDGVLKAAAAWIEREKGIVWTEHRAFGQKLSEITGIGFCSEQGLDVDGKLIDDYNGRPVIATVQANHRGRNLQAWNKNLGVTFPPNGALVEQLIGRTHRTGQMADTVYFTWVKACNEQLDGFKQLLADARYIEDSLMDRQKLNYADYV